MKTLNFILAFILVLISSFTTTVLIYTAFNWFISPSFDIVDITFKQSFAIVMFTSIFFIKYENDGLDDKERYNVIIDKMFMHIFGALLVLIVNFILKSLFI
jgi:hypothetical protein